MNNTEGAPLIRNDTKMKIHAVTSQEQPRDRDGCKVGVFVTCYYMFTLFIPGLKGNDHEIVKQTQTKTVI